MKTSMAVLVLLAGLTGCAGQVKKQDQIVGCLNQPMALLPSKNGKTQTAIIPCLRADGAVMWGQKELPVQAAAPAPAPAPVVEKPSKHKRHAR